MIIIKLWCLERAKNEVEWILLSSELELVRL